jgi:putative cardiolipin synthase
MARSISKAQLDTADTPLGRSTLSESGDLSWLERRGNESARSDKEPGTSWWLRAAVSLLSLLPIDWLL